MPSLPPPSRHPLSPTSPLACALLLFAFTSVNVLNWMDRGIISGAGSLIKGCVASAQDSCSSSPPPPRCNPDEHRDHASCSSRCRVCGGVCDGELVVQTGFGFRDETLGVMQSCFMGGYMVGSLIFAQLAERGHRVFRMMAGGTTVFGLGVLLSGVSGLVSHAATGIALLGAGRVMSGVGEAALVTVGLPYLDSLLGPSVKGRWLAVYFAATPLGTAAGFMWAGHVGKLWRWEYAFLWEAPLIVPFLVFCYAWAWHWEDRLQPALDLDAALSAPLLASSSSSSSESESTLLATLTNGRWVLLSLGLSMFTFTVAGFGFYLPQFLQNYKPCESGWRFDEERADLAVGALVSSAGLVGTLLGGVAVDADASDPHHTVRGATRVSVALLSASGVVMLVAAASTSAATFFAAAWVAITLAFATTAPINLALLRVVPERARPASMALSLIAAHLFGDVPAPVLIGVVSDRSGPHDALLAAWVGLPFGVALWAAAWLAMRGGPPAQAQAQAQEQGTGESQEDAGGASAE